MFKYEEKIDHLLKRGKKLDAVAILSKDEQIFSKTYSNYEEGELHNCYSITKSITSLLALYVSEEYHISLSSPILNYIHTEVKDDMCNKMSIEDFITMRSGFIWEEIELFNHVDNPFKKFTQADDPMKFLFNQEIEESPSKTFNYGPPPLVEEIIRQKQAGLITGEPLTVIGSRHNENGVAIRHLRY